ncbi:MAG: hypothetical protein P4L22_06560 [Candidatus Babeliales bacterium]|nr:hypothetical protein [Candidatus Babeliales bacterium]
MKICLLIFFLNTISFTFCSELSEPLIGQFQQLNDGEIDIKTNDSKDKIVVSYVNKNGKKIILYDNSFFEKVIKYIQSEDSNVISIKSFNSWTKRTRIVSINCKNYHTREASYDHDVEINISKSNRIEIADQT